MLSQRPGFKVLEKGKHSGFSSSGGKKEIARRSERLENSQP
jgi:hypothetical protein